MMKMLWYCVTTSLWGWAARCLAGIQAGRRVDRSSSTNSGISSHQLKFDDEANYERAASTTRERAASGNWFHNLRRISPAAVLISKFSCCVWEAVPRLKRRRRSPRLSLNWNQKWRERLNESAGKRRKRNGSHLLIGKIYHRQRRPQRCTSSLLLTFCFLKWNKLNEKKLDLWTKSRLKGVVPQNSIITDNRPRQVNHVQIFEEQIPHPKCNWKTLIIFPFFILNWNPAKFHLQRSCGLILEFQFSFQW